MIVTDFGGDGPVLLLGPSLGTSAHHLWSDAATLLTDRFHVLAWDLPGHGGRPPVRGFTITSLAVELLDLVDGPFGYAGVSIGGTVGLQLLLDAPERVTSATLLSTGARIGEPEAWRARAARVRREGMAWLVDETPPRWFADANRDSASARALLGELAATDPDSYAAACDALAGFDVRDRLADIERPVLAVAGAQDPTTPPATLRQLADGVVHGRLVVIDGAAHQLPAEAPGVVAALVREVADWTPPPLTSTERLRANGMRVRREVLGDAYVDGASASTDEFTAEFQRFITGQAWGSIWTRPGLDRRSRSLITLTALIAGGQSEELALHVRGALRNGVTPDELTELLLQAAVYCGVPRANAAFRIVRQVLRDEGRL